jgi:hypothetical protein
MSWAENYKEIDSVLPSISAQDIYLLKLPTYFETVFLALEFMIYNFGALVLHTEDPVWFPYRGGEDPEVR